jgi:hypothetical protein
MAPHPQRELRHGSDRRPGTLAPARSRRPVLIFVGGLIGIVLT